MNSYKVLYFGIPYVFYFLFSRCFSVSMLPGNERDDLEHGGKIIMPPSALDQLTRLNIVYPMLFKLTNPATSRTTHCGVLEFIADEGESIWIMMTYVRCVLICRQDGSWQNVFQFNLLHNEGKFLKIYDQCLTTVWNCLAATLEHQYYWFSN